MIHILAAEAGLHDLGGFKGGSFRTYTEFFGAFCIRALRLTSDLCEARENLVNDAAR